MFGLQKPVVFKYNRQSLRLKSTQLPRSRKSAIRESAGCGYKLQRENSWSTIQHTHDA